MFTIKCYNGNRCVIREAESFTILRDHETGGGEITLHQRNAVDDSRVDVADPALHQEGWPLRFTQVIIENQMGKTTEVVQLRSPAFDNPRETALKRGDDLRRKDRVA